MSSRQTPQTKKRWSLKRFLAAFGHTPRALKLVWQTNATLTMAMGVLSIVGGALPVLQAWVGKQIIDGVLRTATSGALASRDLTLKWLTLEFVLVLFSSVAGRAQGVVRGLLRAQLGHEVNYRILEKALTLELRHFEDSEFYDKLTQSRREASVRPLALIQKIFQVAQNSLALAGCAGLLWQVSPGAVLLLTLAAFPSVIAESKFSGEAFQLFRWRTPETRKQNYLEVILARLDYAKEVAIYGLGPRFLARYREIYDSLYEENRALTLRRNGWGLLLGWISSLAFYAVYVWVALEAMKGALTLGEMTMAIMVFRQGERALGGALLNVGGMYEDNLYISTLFEYLDEPIESGVGGAIEGPESGDGVRFEAVGFRYPDASEAALRDVSFHLPAGEKLALVGHNGSGKTTLIKLLARLYQPTEGRILLDGLDLREWDQGALRRRIGVIFQDFARYQLLAGENIGAGDAATFDDEDGWRRAAELGMAAPLIDGFEDGYQTQLGRWFGKGRELSHGQWQKVALSRAFMRADADLLVLDEPTAAMDAEAELAIFEHVRKVSENKMAILISHRFSTVRMADHIVLLESGRVIEQGTHRELLDLDGTYARFYTLQAAAFRDEKAEGPDATEDTPSGTEEEGDNARDRSSG